MRRRPKPKVKPRKKGKPAVQTQFIDDTSRFFLQAQNVDDTPVEMTTDGAAATVSNTVNLPNNSIWEVKIAAAIRSVADPDFFRYCADLVFVVSRGATEADIEVGILPASASLPYDLFDNPNNGYIPGASPFDSGSIDMDVNTTRGGLEFILSPAADPDTVVTDARIEGSITRLFE